MAHMHEKLIFLWMNKKIKVNQTATENTFRRISVWQNDKYSMEHSSTYLQEFYSYSDMHSTT